MYFQAFSDDKTAQLIIVASYQVNIFCSSFRKLTLVSGAFWSVKSEANVEVILSSYWQEDSTGSKKKFQLHVGLVIKTFFS